MSDTVSLNLSLLKHSDIREEIKNYLKSKYNITYTDGSNYNYLVDTLAILNMYTAYQMSSVAKNITMTAINDRQNAVSRSQLLGYSPKKKIPAYINGNLKIVKDLSAGLSITNFTFTGTDTGLPFTTNDIVISSSDIADYLTNPGVYVIPFMAKQIEQRTITTKLDSTLKVIIDSDMIAEEDISVTVNSISYTAFSNFDGIPTSTDTVFFVSEDPTVDGRLIIEFGNGIIGASVSTDAEIEVSYYITNGTEGNAETDLTIETFTSDVLESEMTITDITFSYGGRDRETIDEIKANAPRYFCTKNRLVTAKDYEALLKKIVDTSIRYFSIIDAYSSDNLENFYKLGNIYISVVPNSIYTINNTANDLLTNNETLPINYVTEITIPNETISELLDTYSDNFIVGTNRVVVSPTYLYTDIYPSVEFVNKNYNVSIFNSDMLPDFQDYMYEIEGLGIDFREDKITSMMMNDTRIKGCDLNIDFSVLTNYSNITGLYKWVLPKDIIINNTDAYFLDNKYLGYSYKMNEMPDNRKSFYGELKVDSDYGFNRYLVSDTYSVGNNTTIGTELYITVPETITDIDTSDYYSFQSEYLIMPDGSNAEIVIKTRNDYDTDNPYKFPLITGTGTANDKIPLKYTEDSNVRNSNVSVDDTEVYFIYFRKNTTYYLLATVNYVVSNDIVNYEVNYINISNTTNTEIYELLTTNNYVCKNGRAIIPMIDYTHGLSSIESEEPQTKISFYLLNNTGMNSIYEYVKVKSYKPVGTITIDSNNKMNMTDVSDPFVTPVKSETNNYEYLTIGVATSVPGSDGIVLVLRRSKTSGLIDLNGSTTYAYPSDSPDYDTYLDNSFHISNNVLYCHEIIHDTIIGTYNRGTGEVAFNESVYFNNSYDNKLTAFFSTYGIIDDLGIYQIHLRNNYEITDEKIKYIHDFDTTGGICCLYNFHGVTKI